MAGLSLHRGPQLWRSFSNRSLVDVRCDFFPEGVLYIYVCVCIQYREDSKNCLVSLHERGWHRDGIGVAIFVVPSRTGRRPCPTIMRSTVYRWFHALLSTPWTRSRYTGGRAQGIRNCSSIRNKTPRANKTCKSPRSNDNERGVRTEKIRVSCWRSIGNFRSDRVNWIIEIQFPSYRGEFPWIIIPCNPFSTIRLEK